MEYRKLDPPPAPGGRFFVMADEGEEDEEGAEATPLDPPSGEHSGVPPADPPQPPASPPGLGS